MTSTPSHSALPRPRAVIESSGNFSVGADPLPRTFLLLAGMEPEALPDELNADVFIARWQQLGGEIEENAAKTAVRCTALILKDSQPTRLVYTCQKGTKTAGTLSPIADLPVLRCVFDRTVGSGALIAASRWDNSMLALCLEDGMRQAGINATSRSDIPLRDMKSPVGFYGTYTTMPGAASHLLLGAVSPVSAAEALKASLTVLGRRLESVRFEMAEGVVRARKAAHFGNR